MGNAIFASVFVMLAIFATSATGLENSEQALEVKYFANIQCKSEVFSKLKTLKATHEWSLPNAREVDGSRRFHSPSQIIGVWIEARIFMNNEVLLRRITAHYVETITFDLRSCASKKSTTKSRALFAQAEAKRDSFTDHDVRDLLARNGRGLIYIWSPNMPYSFQRVHGKSGIESVSEVARKLGLRVTVVMDPAANASYAREIVNKYDYLKVDYLRSAQSIELALRSMRTHYPAVLVYANGHLARHGYPGVGTTKEYLKYIRGALNDLPQK